MRRTRALGPGLFRSQSLSAALHRRGTRILGDLTTDHSGSAHAWFQRALADKSAPEAAYYYFTDHPHNYVAWFAVPSRTKAREARRCDPGVLIRRSCHRRAGRLCCGCSLQPPMLSA